MVNAVVVDTDVLSFTFKRHTHAGLYRPHLDGKLLVISFMTLAELDRWAITRNWGERRKQDMESFLRQFVLYPYDRALCLKWAEAGASAAKNGYTINTADGWIAATALLHNIPLVTNNRTNFQGIDGLVIISEAP
jgi:predicted nucleic acid-binding protein